MSVWAREVGRGESREGLEAGIAASVLTPLDESYTSEEPGPEWVGWEHGDNAWRRVLGSWVECRDCLVMSALA